MKVTKFKTPKIKSVESSKNLKFRAFTKIKLFSFLTKFMISKLSNSRKNSKGIQHF